MSSFARLQKVTSSTQFFECAVSVRFQVQLPLVHVKAAELRGPSVKVFR